MNRRKFFETSGAVLATAGSTSLFSKTIMVDDKHIKDSLVVTSIKDRDYRLDKEEFVKLSRLNRKLRNLRSVVGYGNFNLLGLDETIDYGKRYSRIGEFSKDDLDLLEELFYHSAAAYGFYGEKVLTKITDNINKNDTIKVPYTGHFLFKGKPVYMYDKIRREVGEEHVILTSGVRGIIKQTQLFVSKVVKTRGNVSLASRSLAPPGYSYHGVGDFDIGKVGFGYRNFTSDFAKTDEFKKLMDLGYITIRYPMQNPFGVRFEPWHIKVI